MEELDGQRKRRKMQLAHMSSSLSRSDGDLRRGDDRRALLLAEFARPHAGGENSISSIRRLLPTGCGCAQMAGVAARGMRDASSVVLVASGRSEVVKK